MELFKYQDFEKLEKTKDLIKIRDGKLIFDDSTRDLEFVDLGQYEDDVFQEAQITEVEFATEQPNLRYLDLSYCKLKKITIRNCPNLQALYLYNCELEEIRFEGEFPRLQLIDLSANNLTSLELTPDRFPSLKYLYFDGNQIKDLSFLSPFVLRDEYFDFSFRKNPIENPPADVVGEDNDKVREWIKAEKQKLNEIKIILIGDAAAGKTSLLRRLKHNEFDENEPQTDGINIEEIDFGQDKHGFSRFDSLKGVHGYFWDFGGQEIMSATHTFFLTKRTVYILLIEARKDEQANEQIRKWIRKIATYAEDVPVIVVANKIDVNRGFDFTNSHRIREEFPQIKEFVKISCKTGENIDLLREKIAHLVPQAGYFNTWIDIRWIKLKDKLRQELSGQKYYLDETTFKQIARDMGLKSKQSQEAAVQFLHNLGVVLHFDEIYTADYYILDPYWVTYGVYRILTSERAAVNKGRVHLKELDFIVNEEEKKLKQYKPKNFRKIEYNKTEQKLLVDILNKFKLCYYVSQDEFIIPDLLEGNPPQQVTQEFEVEDNDRFLQLVYDYKFIPPTIMPQLIVDIQRIYNLSVVWKTGFVIEHNGCKAYVNEYENQIFIKIKGPKTIERRNLMAAVAAIVDKLNDNLNTKASKKIPLPGLKGEYVSYEKLVRRRNKKKLDYIYHEDEEDEKRFNILDLLDGLPEPEVIDKIKKELEYSGKEINQRLDELESKLDTLLPELKNLIQSLNTEAYHQLEDLIAQASKINAETQEVIFRQILDYIDNSEEQILAKIDEKYLSAFKSQASGSGIAKLSYSFSFLKLLDLSGIPVGSAIDAILQASGVNLSVDLVKLIKNVFGRRDKG